MFRLVRYASILCALAFIAGACTQEDKKEEASATADLVGNWAIPCHPAARSGGYEADIYVFQAGGTFAFNVVLYSDACQTQTQSYQVTGTYVIGAATTTPSDGTKIDFTVVDATLPGVNAGDKSYDIYKVVGTSIYFGNSSGANDGSSDVLRPTTWSDTPFIKY